MDELITCPKCNGSGIHINHKTKEVNGFCKHCKGHIKLDWIEMVMGKNAPTPSYQDLYDLCKLMGKSGFVLEGNSVLPKSK